MVGDCVYDVINGVHDIHAKFTFYRSDATVDGVMYKKGTLVVEPTDEKGWLNIQRDSFTPWKCDAEIKETATRIIFKQKEINGKKVPLVLKNSHLVNMHFSGLKNVQIIDLRGLVFDPDDQLNILVERMFESCENMHTVLFNPSHTFKNTRYFDRMFATCANLSHVLAKEPSEAVSYDELDEKKEECDLSGLAIFNTSSAISMPNMFECCYKMTDFRFSEYPHWDTSKVKDFNGMFTAIQCMPATNGPTQAADVFSLKDGKIINATGGFKLKKLDLSALDTSSARNMRYMFMGQEGLEELNLSGKFKFNNKVATDSMFKGVHALRKITVGKDFHLSNNSHIAEPSDNIFNTYIRPHFKKDDTNTYSGKWVPDGKDAPELSSEDFWNSSKLENLTKDLSDGESLTMVWQLKTPAAPTIPQLTLLTETGDFEVEINGKKVKRFAISGALTSDKKIDTSTLPQTNADGKAIVGWYKQGDASKTKIDVATAVFEENTTLIALYDDSGSGGGTTGGGTTGDSGGDTGGSGTGGTGDVPTPNPQDPTPAPNPNGDGNNPSGNADNPSGNADGSTGSNSGEGSSNNASSTNQNSGKKLVKSHKRTMRKVPQTNDLFGLSVLGEVTALGGALFAGLGVHKKHEEK